MIKEICTTCLLFAVGAGAGTVAPVKFQESSHTQSEPIYAPMENVRVVVDGRKIQIWGNLPETRHCKLSSEMPPYAQVANNWPWERFTRHLFGADGSRTDTAELVEVGGVIPFRGQYWKEPPGNPEWSQFWLVMTCELDGGRIVRPRVGPFPNPERL